MRGPRGEAVLGVLRTPRTKQMGTDRLARRVKAPVVVLGVLLEKPGAFMNGPSQAALATLPERRQREQTQIWRTPFGVWALTRWRLGFHFLGDDLWEWLTLWPKTGPFAQISQTFGMVVSLSLWFEPLLYHKSGR
jgi:hypothetical protein